MATAPWRARLWRSPWHMVHLLFHLLRDAALKLVTVSARSRCEKPRTWQERQRTWGWLLLTMGGLSCDPKATPSNASAPNASVARKARSAEAKPETAPSQPSETSQRAAVPSYRQLLAERTRHAPAPAKDFANLKPASCAAELRRRQLPVKPARAKTPGLASPLRLIGPLRGVKFELPRTIYGLMDCRLVLLLDELSEKLSQHEVVAVVVNNAYRPSSKLPPASKAPSSPTQRRRQPRQLSQHALGLAIDVMAFRLADGRVLNVEQDWRGARGENPCGPKSRVRNEHPAGVALRNLTCAIATAGYCNHLITPSRDEAHANHLHCDIEAGANEVTVE